MSDELKKKQDAVRDAMAELFYFHCLRANAAIDEGDKNLYEYHTRSCASIISARIAMENWGVI